MKIILEIVFDGVKKLCLELNIYILFLVCLKFENLLFLMAIKFKAIS